MKLNNNNAARSQNTTRTGSTQPTSQKSNIESKPTPSRSVDSFQSVRTKAPVVLAPTETVAQERSRRRWSLPSRRRRR